MGLRGATRPRAARCRACGPDRHRYGGRFAGALRDDAPTRPRARAAQCPPRPGRSRRRRGGRRPGPHHGRHQHGGPRHRHRARSRSRAARRLARDPVPGEPVAANRPAVPRTLRAARRTRELRDASRARCPPAPARRRAPARVACAPARTPRAALAAAPRARCAPGAPAPGPTRGGAGPKSLQPLGCLIEPHRVVELGSPVIGVIESIEVERGDRVRKGQVIAMLRSDVERAAVGVAASKAQVSAEVQAAQANYDLARGKYERAKDLVERKFISSQALEQARADSDVAEQKLAQAREQPSIYERELKLAEAQLGMRTIRSPANGVIAERYLSPGERVEEKPIVRLATIDPLRVEVVIPAQLFGTIQAGSFLSVVPELPNAKPRLAKVVLVDPLIDGPSNTFRARLHLPNPNYEVPAGLGCQGELGGETQAGADAERPVPPMQPIGKQVPGMRPARNVPQVKAGGNV